MELAPRRLPTERKTRPAGHQPASAGAEGMDADQAIVTLRRKIGQRLKGGPHGLMRCWLQFRERSGGTKEGITYAEFCHGLKNYDVIVTDAVSREVFDRMDKNGDGHIQITEFVNHVMGRWSAETNTIVDQHVRAGHGKNLDESPLDLTADEARAARTRAKPARLCALSRSPPAHSPEDGKCVSPSTLPSLTLSLAPGDPPPAAQNWPAPQIGSVRPAALLDAVPRALGRHEAGHHLRRVQARAQELRPHPRGSRLPRG